jgi:Zn-dependent protease
MTIGHVPASIVPDQEGHLLLFGGNVTPEYLLSVLLVLLIGMTVHEFAHNYVGWRMGDPEPQRMGRLTLNPFVHINWVGWLMFALIGFGILGSAPISPYRMPRENRRWRWFAAVAAGPVSNLLLAIATGIIMRLIGVNTLSVLPNFVVTFLSLMIFFNLILFLFNLLPLFPIDGWSMVYALLPPALAIEWEKYRSTTQFVFFALLLLTFVPGLPSPLNFLIFEPASGLFRALRGF